MTRPGSRAALDLEGRRLRTALRLIVAGVAGAASVQACSQSSPGAPADASTADHAAAPADGSADASPDAPDGDDALSAPDVSCTSTLYFDAAYFPDGSDADICPVYLPCGVPSALTVSQCQLMESDSAIGCSISREAGCAADGTWTGTGGLLTDCWCTIFIPGGRSNAWSRRHRQIQATSAIGAFFARMATEEAASVHAFERLRDELRALGAPSDFVTRAGASARDEVRHARAMTTLARAHSAAAAPCRSPRAVRRRRTLYSVAHENAVEGCVRETFGALVTHWQAAKASDPPLRRVFARIAEDETRHAALAWSIAAWAEPRLGDREARRIQRARRAAFQSLVRASACAVPEDVSTATGFPRPAEARALLAGMGQAMALGA